MISHNNLHIHVEGTMLAVGKVDYLGYTLSRKGLQPQIQKIQPLLALALLKNVRQLHSFITLVNYYKMFWPCQSDTMEPLTRVLRSAAAFKFGPEPLAVFNATKQFIACQVVLHFPCPHW
jgi:hypothetical protein